MNGSIKKLTADKILWWGLLVTFGFIILNFITIILFYKNLPPLLPLFNQLPWGVARLGEKPMIFIPAFSAFLLLCFNVIFQLWLYNKMPLVSRMIAITSVLISLISFIFTFRTILLIS